MFLLCPLKIWMWIIIVRMASYDDVTPEKICTTGNISRKVWQKLRGNQSENSNLFKQYCSCSSISQSCPFSLRFQRGGVNFTSRNLNASRPFVNSVWIAGISCLFIFLLTKGRIQALEKVSAKGVRFCAISWGLIRRRWYILRRLYLLMTREGCVLDGQSWDQPWFDQDIDGSPITSVFFSLVINKWTQWSLWQIQIGDNMMDIKNFDYDVACSFI